MKYDIFRHGIGTKILNIKTGESGIVSEIRETGHEWIEPFVDYGDGILIKENTSNMEVILDTKKKVDYAELTGAMVRDANECGDIY